MVSMVNIRVCYNTYKIVTFRVPEVQYTRISNNICHAYLHNLYISPHAVHVLNL